MRKDRLCALVFRVQQGAGAEMRITIGSPIYERPEPAFVVSLIALLDELREREHDADWRYASGVVHWARNYVMNDMMREGPDVLVQLDVDHQFEAEDVAEAIELVGEGHVPMVGFACLGRKPKNAHEPPPWATPVVRHPVRSSFEYRGRKYIEVDAVGGGLLVCSRGAIELLSADAPRQSFGDAPVLFDFRVNVSEDTFFCDRWREMGGKIYCDMTSLTGHIGSRVYAMNPQHLLSSLEFEENAEYQVLE